MKHTLTLAAWNFRLARRYLLALWGIFARPAAGAGGLSHLLARRCRHGAGVPLLRYHANFYLSWVLSAYRFGGWAGHPQQPPRPQRVHLGHAARTPGQKFGAKAITIAAAEVIFAAWQFVWYIVEFYPVTALEVHLAASCTARPCRPPTCTSRSSPTTCFPACCRAAPCSW